MIYSNPRLLAVFEDWPYGTQKTRCTFTVESGPRGERISRVTVNPKNGSLSAPKTTTYARKVRIVDGSDGKTYVATLTAYGTIGIMQSNLQFSQESIFNSDPGFPAALALFD